MKLPKRVITDYQVITEIDRDEDMAGKIKVWSRLGYKLYGSMNAQPCTIHHLNGNRTESIVYTQAMVKYEWRLV